MDKNFIKKVRRSDRIASRLITVGGLVTIASVIAILFLIVRVTVPLFLPAKAQTVAALPLGGDRALLGAGVDDYQEICYTLDANGLVSFYRISDGSLLKQVALAGSPSLSLRSAEVLHNNFYTLLWSDATVTVAKVSFALDYDQQGRRHVLPQAETLKSFPAESPMEEARAVVVRAPDDEHLTRIALLPDNTFWVTRQQVSTDLFDNVTTETSSYTIAEEMPGNITAFTVNQAGTALYAGTDSGNLLHWDISGNEDYRRLDNIVAVADGRSITALGLVLGDISIAVGDSAGGLSTWMPVRTDAVSNIKKLRKIHILAPHDSAVTRILPSSRNKCLTSMSEKGVIHLDHMTSENHLLTLGSGLTMFGLSDRGNSMVGAGPQGSLTVWNIDNPHPEISFKTLFGKVWYENYDKPAYVWQSSSGSDDFEPKFSIIPLLFGTFKGTLYAMIFAIPLAIFGAAYTSQFTTPAYKRAIKPIIEIMASVPSVVIGFLIALWLAPIVERAILPVLLSFIILPVVFILFMAVLKPFYSKEAAKNAVKGYEFILLVPVVLITAALAYFIAPFLENLLFNGNFKLWLFSDLGMRYDQRNSIIIAFGLGIAVIPIIFSITEDAISNIPPSLTAASLALGASRWQTVWRVVLPSASPGIFAAIMIGFGRAVGETMIVLMATGNTPILDWSIFDGMRTLSANIAVEIPEAPVDGTLYRVLFLCSVLLFALTFILNTGAELIREHLRKKYGRY